MPATEQEFVSDLGNNSILVEFQGRLTSNPRQYHNGNGTKFTQFLMEHTKVYQRNFPVGVERRTNNFECQSVYTTGDRAMLSLRKGDAIKVKAQLNGADDVIHIFVTDFTILKQQQYSEAQPRTSRNQTRQKSEAQPRTVGNPTQTRRPPPTDRRPPKPAPKSTPPHPGKPKTRPISWWKW